MALVKLPGKFETTEDDCFIAVNVENLTFITPGPKEIHGGTAYTQLYFHFLGGIESIGFWVQDMDSAIEALGVLEQAGARKIK